MITLNLLRTILCYTLNLFNLHISNLGTAWCSGQSSWLILYSEFQLYKLIFDNTRLAGGCCTTNQSDRFWKQSGWPHVTSTSCLRSHPGYYYRKIIATSRFVESIQASPLILISESFFNDQDPKHLTETLLSNKGICQRVGKWVTRISNSDFLLPLTNYYKNCCKTKFYIHTTTHTTYNKHSQTYNIRNYIPLIQKFTQLPTTESVNEIAVSQFFPKPRLYYTIPLTPQSC